MTKPQIRDTVWVLIPWVIAVVFVVTSRIQEEKVEDELRRRKDWMLTVQEWIDTAADDRCTMADLENWEAEFRRKNNLKGIDWKMFNRTIPNKKPDWDAFSKSSGTDQ